MAQLVKKIRTEQGDLQIDYNSLANKPNHVNKAGDTMTGNLTMQSSGAVPTITMHSLENTDGQAATARISKNAGDTVDYGLQLRDYAHGDAESNNSIILGISNAKSLKEKMQLIHQVDGKNHYYNVYGEHNKPTLSDLGVTATAAELNKLDGITATTAELNYCDGVTSNIQTQLNGKAASSHGTHVVWGTETPKVAGTASVGTATTAARSDHVHPAQTAITGNAGSATKLQTARGVITDLSSTVTDSFDGTSSITPGVKGTLGIANGGTGATTAAAARSALGAVAKDGDTMTGNLIINTGASSAIGLQAPNNSAGKQSYSRIYKNASATADYGLQLRDYAHGGNETNTSCMLMLNSAQSTLAKKIQFSNQINGETTNYELYGEHNQPALASCTGTLGISQGGTGATSVSGVLANLGNIGKTYIANPDSFAVAKEKFTNLYSVTLPAGTYVIFGNHQWSDSSMDNIYVDRIRDSSDNIYSLTRNFMNGGGGISTVAIVVLTASTSIVYDTYHNHTASMTATNIHFGAVKIK